MTRAEPRATLSAPRPFGAARRLVLGLACLATWVGAAVVMVAAFVPEIEGGETEVQVQLGLVLAGLAIAAAPVLVLWLPERRRVSLAVEAVLRSAPQQDGVPPVDRWAPPQQMFGRLRWHAAQLALIPLITLVGLAIAYGFYLDEDAAGTVCAVFAVVPLLALVVVATLPLRLRSSVRGGRAVAVLVERRLDQQLTFSPGRQSWFDARLPNGEQVLLRTPVHFARDAVPRGVVESPDLVLVVGRGGHQGALLDPSRPQDAVWLLGPVPLTRVPLSVWRDLAAIES